VTGETISYGLVEVNGAPADSELRVPTTLITNGLGGSYILRVEVDFLNDIEEIDEENNTLVIQAPLVVGSSSGTPSDPGTSPGSGSGNGGGSGNNGVPPGTQSEADLTITDFSLPSIVPSGVNVNIDFTVFNQGIQDASTFVVRVFYNNNNDSGDGLHEIERINVGGLAAKQGIDLRVRFDTSGLGASRYNIIVIVDVFNQVQESFEGNNRQERWLKIS
jgi:subtilase family serine protease